MLPVIHRACGKPAFYYTRKIQRGEPLYPIGLIRPVEGAAPPVEGELIRCGSCGKAPINTEDFDFSQVLEP